MAAQQQVGGVVAAGGWRENGDDGRPRRAAAGAVGAAVSAEQDAARHGPVLERMRAIIKRGQDNGDFDRSVSPDWLLAAVLGLGRIAEDEVKAGRMTVEEATHAVRHGFLRLLGLPDQEPT